MMFKLEDLTEQDINTILNSIAAQPYKDVRLTMQKLEQQINAQLKPAT